MTDLLGWLTDRILEEQEDRKDRKENQADGAWALDATAFPPSYWHWIHTWRQFRDEHPEASGGPLPTRGPVLSLVVPVYRPMVWYFRECVQSVLAQTYQDWELCLCDDGSGDPELTAVMQAFAAADPRITALALEQNGGISRATNRAVEAATGEFVVLLDHDDLLEPDALAELARVVLEVDDVDVIYSDEDKMDELGRLFQPHFKCDWDPELLLSYPYLGHITAIRRDVLDHVGGFRPEFDGSQDYDVMLRSTEMARRVVHIPKVLYHWRIVAGSAAGDPDAKPWATMASRRALQDAVARRGIDGTVESGPFQGAYHLRRTVSGSPTVGVIIPFRDQGALTVACLESIGRSPGHPIQEIVLVDNGSTEPETRELRSRLEARPDVRVLDYPGPFNWAAINNAAAAVCTTDMLLFLNNDVEAESDGWLHALVEQAQRPEVGAVGARLTFPDGRLQHAGVVLGLGALAGHLFMGMPAGRGGYYGWDRITRGVSAVTAACMLVRREVFEQVGGFDEQFAVAYNDVDFCIRLGRAGLSVLYSPHAGLTHHESVSRGLSGYSSDNQAFIRRWRDVLVAGDPYYSRNLSRIDFGCTLRPVGEDEEWLAILDGLVGPEG
jgi:GT2 family glycosyltransferase